MSWKKNIIYNWRELFIKKKRNTESLLTSSKQSILCKAQLFFAKRMMPQQGENIDNAKQFITKTLVQKMFDLTSTDEF